MSSNFEGVSSRLSPPNQLLEQHQQSQKATNSFGRALAVSFSLWPRATSIVATPFPWSFPFMQHYFFWAETILEKAQLTYALVDAGKPPSPCYLSRFELKTNTHHNFVAWKAWNNFGSHLNHFLFSLVASGCRNSRWISPNFHKIAFCQGWLLTQSVDHCHYHLQPLFSTYKGIYKNLYHELLDGTHGFKFWRL